MVEKTSVARKRLFIKSDLQKRYLILIVSAMLAPSLVILGCLYYLMVWVLARELVFPEAIFLSLAPTIQRINWILLFGLPGLCLLVFACALRFSHRLAGPIHRMETDLDKIAQGNRTLRLTLRKADALKPFADKVNEVLDAVLKNGGVR